MAVERIASTDFHTLNELKIQAKNDAKKALPEVAKQFEGIFLQSMLKTMRMSQHFVEQSSPFRGKNEETFQEMLDGQYVSKIVSSPNGVGLADMLTKQLGGTVGATKDRTVDMAKLKIGDVSPKGIAYSAAATPSNPTTLSAIDSFVKSIWSKAKEAASTMGLDPKVLVAQAALETGWGQSVAKDTDGSSSNNLFNIKSSSSSGFESVNVNTTEYIADTPIRMSASFRKYSSVEDSFNDYISLIKGSNRYQDALANAANPERYLNELSKAGYATDPNYSTKILSIYNGNELNEAIKRCDVSKQV